MTTTHVSPFTPIPADIQQKNPQLYQYLKRLEDAVARLTGGLNATETSASSIQQNISASLPGKADKVAGATAGHLASLDSLGNLEDSGYAATATPTEASVPIADGSGKLNAWVDMPSIDGFWVINLYGDLVPADTPTTSDTWELNGYGDVVPK